MDIMRTEYRNLSTGTIRSGNTAHAESLADIESYLFPVGWAATAGLVSGGVLTGLGLAAALGGPDLTVGPGCCVDGLGRVVVLSVGGSAVVDPAANPDDVENVSTVIVETDGVVLPSPGESGDFVVLASWREVAFPDRNAFLRRHAPWVRVVSAADLVPSTTEIALGEVSYDVDGLVTAVRPGQRQQVTVAAGGVRLGATLGAADALTDRVVGELTGRADGGVELSLVSPGGSRTAWSVDGSTGETAILSGLRVTDVAEAGHGFTMTAAADGAWRLTDAGTALDRLLVDATGSLAVGGPAARANLSVSGDAVIGSGGDSTLAVHGSLSVDSTLAVHGSLSVDSTVFANDDLRVGPGAGAPLDNLEVVSNVRIGTGANPVRFTSVWSSFPDSTTNQAEICNSVESAYRSLMIVGNRSSGTRTVAVWDRLEVHGQSCANAFCNLSDGRLKTDVETIGSPLDKVTQLRGVSFRWKDGVAEGAQLGAGVGVIAQEVADVFPELVSTIGPAQHLGVEYNGLTALLIEAVKQLKADNDDLRRRVDGLNPATGGRSTGSHGGGGE